MIKLSFCKQVNIWIDVINVMYLSRYCELARINHKRNTDKVFFNVVKILVMYVCMFVPKKILVLLIVRMISKHRIFFYKR